MNAPVPFDAIAAIALTIGWLICKSWDRDRITHWKDFVAEYKKQARQCIA